jgi:hypothetical protein
MTRPTPAQPSSTAADIEWQPTDGTVARSVNRDPDNPAPAVYATMPPATPDFPDRWLAAVMAL